MHDQTIPDILLLNRFPDYYSITIKHMIKRPFFCNTMLSVLPSFLAHCLSIYGQFSVVVFEVGTFFIHEYYTNAMRTLQKKHVPIYELRPILSG